MDLELTGASCLVTGAASGIGRATAVALAAEGARVMLTDRAHEPLAEVAGECRTAGGEADHETLDLTAPGATERLLDRAQARFGPLDVLINGVGARGRIVVISSVSAKQPSAVNAAYSATKELADVIAFLASPRAANVIGSAWTADGGSARQLF